jgi:hypothetical protein
MSADLGSRSDLEALRRSGRGKVLVVAVLLVAALGAAAWAFLFRNKGTGNAEDPGKVILVTTTRGHSIGLTELGFDAAEGTFDAWVAKAEDEVPDLEVDGIEAIMELADRFGYGYVVFEKPQDIDFSMLDIEGGPPTIPDHARFAVVSAGDLAFPHVLTVNPEPSEVMQGNAIVLLQALFEQEALAATLEAEDSTSMEVVKLKDRLSDAVEKLERVPQAELMADKIVAEVRRQLVDAERADPKPSPIARPLESVGPIPLANGQILGVSRGFRVVTRDAVRADLDLEDEERFVVGAVDGAPEARVRCDALAGGAISVHESPRYWPADDGGAILLQTLSAGYELWTLDNALAGPCGFTKAGAIAARGPGVANEAAPHRSGKVARAGVLAGQGIVSVVSAGGGEEQLLGMLDDVELRDPTWLDARFVAAIAQGGAEPDQLVLFDLDEPLQVVTIPATVFDGANKLGEVAVASLADKPRLVVTAGGFPMRVYRLDLPRELGALLSDPPLPPDLVIEPRDGLPTAMPIDTNALTVVALTHEGVAQDVSVSPDGRWVALSLSDGGLDERNPGDSEIALVPMDAQQGGAGMQLLTRNALRDYEPRFTADGAYVVFKTRVEIPKTQWRITAPRAVVLAR